MAYVERIVECIIDRYLWIPSLLLCAVYILVLVVLVRHRKADFNTTLFKITTSLGAADVLSYMYISPKQKPRAEYASRNRTHYTMYVMHAHLSDMEMSIWDQVLTALNL